MRREPPEPVRLTAFAFADADHGRVADEARLPATADGGRTWTFRYAFGETVTQLDFVSPERGWAVADEALFATDDAGQTWTEVALPEAEAVRAVDFADARHGYAWTGSAFLASGDGGGTWAAANLPCHEYDYPVFSFPEPALGWVVCAGQPATQQQLKQVFRTGDEGHTWELVADTGLPGYRPAVGRLVASGHTRAVFFLDERRGWLAQSRGTLLTTYDGGETWDPVAGLAHPESGYPESLLHAVQFLTEEHGFVIVATPEPALYETRDGGDTFNWSRWAASGDPASRSARSSLTLQQQGGGYRPRSRNS